MMMIERKETKTQRGSTLGAALCAFVSLCSVVVAGSIVCGCSDYAVEETPLEPVTPSLAFSVSGSQGHITRMATDVVQYSGERSQYRGISSLVLIPFQKQGVITAADKAWRLFDGSEPEAYPKDATSAQFDPHTGGLYLYRGFSMMRGTASFLVYGQAPAGTPAIPSELPATSGMSGDVLSNAYYGAIVRDIPATQDPDGITFSPMGITTVEALSADGAPAALVACYLTYIAEAEATYVEDEQTKTVQWSTTTDSQLRAYYQNFTGQETYTGQDDFPDDTNYRHVVMAGSSTNAIAFVNALYQQVSGLTYTDGTAAAALRAEILNRIKTQTQEWTDLGLNVTFDNENNRLTGLGVNYPAVVGLPDGAAALRWAKKSDDSGYAFVPQTQTTTVANVNTVSRFSYPPALCYYVNSRIDTSNKEQAVIDAAYISATNWTALVGDGESVAGIYENKMGIVTGNTTSVAIHDPLQYAVGRLDIALNACSSPLTDAFNNNVVVGNESFPLTGIIVGGQRPVGFDFTPIVGGGETPSDLNTRFIYDAFPTGTTTSLYLNTTGSGDNTTSTLVLQTPDNEKITIILEFQNNSGTKFRGHDGVVYPGTHFYLIGTIDPSEASGTGDEDYRKRVFTRDFTTTVHVGVPTLANAYNVMPDILSARLEVGVELVTNWQQTTPTVVPLNE